MPSDQTVITPEHAAALDRLGAAFAAIAAHAPSHTAATGTFDSCGLWNKIKPEADAAMTALAALAVLPGMGWASKVLAGWRTVEMILAGLCPVATFSGS